MTSIKTKNVARDTYLAIVASESLWTEALIGAWHVVALTSIVARVCEALIDVTTTEGARVAVLALARVGHVVMRWLAYRIVGTLALLTRIGCVLTTIA